MSASVRIVRGRKPTSRSSRSARTGSVERAWWYDVEQTARAHGALPYLVEGFTEIADAVRRGHAVLVRRAPAEVANDTTIFADADPNDVSVVAVLRFDSSTARFVLQDPASVVGSIQLTPRRLACYLDDPTRSTGIALGG